MVGIEVDLFMGVYSNRGDRSRGEASVRETVKDKLGSEGDRPGWRRWKIRGAASPDITRIKATVGKVA